MCCVGVWCGQGFSLSFANPTFGASHGQQPGEDGEDGELYADTDALGGAGQAVTMESAMKMIAVVSRECPVHPCAQASVCKMGGC